MLPSSLAQTPTGAATSVRRISDLVTSSLHVALDTPISTVAKVFEQNPELDSLAVLGGVQVRLLSRTRFFLQLGRRFGYSLCENRPVDLLAEEGSTVEAGAEPLEVITLATQREAARLCDDIIVLEQDLVRSLEPLLLGKPVAPCTRLGPLGPSFSPIPCCCGGC